MIYNELIHCTICNLVQVSVTGCYEHMYPSSWSVFCREIVVLYVSLAKSPLNRHFVFIPGRCLSGLPSNLELDLCHVPQIYKLYDTLYPFSLPTRHLELLFLHIMFKKKSCSSKEKNSCFRQHACQLTLPVMAFVVTFLT